MTWYVLAVTPGTELRVIGRLRGMGIRAAVPRQLTDIRKGGKWREKTELLIPGYVFADIKYTPKAYQQIKSVGNVIRILPNPLHPEPIRPDEERVWKMFLEIDRPLKASGIVHSGDTIRIISGPLLGFEGYIIKIDLRQRRATVRLPLPGGDKTVTLPVRQLTKSEI